MVKHVICFKLKDRSKSSAEEAKMVLLGMENNVPQVRKIDVHLDELRSQRSYDVMLEVLVDDWNSLDEYQKDRYHCDVVKTYMHAHTETSVAMDYEVK